MGRLLHFIPKDKDPAMFKELAPLLSKRSLILTITSVADERIRVTITPRPTGKDDVKELSQPFAVEGTAEELDTELPVAIVSYTAEHMTLENSLAQVKAGMEATLKEVKDEAAKKVADAKKTAKVGTKTPAVPAKAAEVKAPEPPSLFDVAAPTAETTPAPVLASTTAAAESDEAEEEEDQDRETPEDTVTEIAAVASASDLAQSMFDQQAEEEAEIMREAFPEMGGQLIAA
jgi:PRTRC genetic system protein E